VNLWRDCSDGKGMSGMRVGIRVMIGCGSGVVGIRWGVGWVWGGWGVLFYGFVLVQFVIDCGSSIIDVNDWMGVDLSW
jgi:hypothetical protein